MKNTDISRLLGKRWKALPLSIRQPHIDREHREREAYKTKIAEWREERKKVETLSRQQREAVATQYVNSGCGIFPPPQPSVPPQPRNQWGATATKATPFVTSISTHYDPQNAALPPPAINTIYRPSMQSSLYSLPVLKKECKEEKSVPEEPASIAEMLEGQRGGFGGKLSFQLMPTTGILLLSLYF